VAAGINAHPDRSAAARQGGRDWSIGRCRRLARATAR
jgi:hypothetical protein